MTSHTCTYDQACTLKSNSYTRTGYTFAGWKKDNSGTTYAAGTSIKNIVTGGTATFFAQWSANTFTVAYNANGGSGTTSSHTCSYDGACTLKSNSFTRTGYTFAGWKKANSGTTLAAGANIKNAATGGTATYYAQWSANTFTVAYNANGGTGTTSSHTCTYDQACTLKSNSFTRAGYQFAGWKLNNSGATLGAGTNIKNAATGGTVTYYAQWSANTFTVAYNANGGTGTTSSHTCTYDQACTLKSNSFTRAGYQFAGWKLNNSGATLGAGTSIANVVTSGTVTYYAQWSASTFTVVYNANGGTGTTPSHTCNVDSSCVLSSNNYTRSDGAGKNYGFVGWKRDNNGNTLGAGTNIINATTAGNTVTYYAQWERCNQWVCVKNCSDTNYQNQQWVFTRNCQIQYGWIYTTRKNPWPDSYLATNESNYVGSTAYKNYQDCWYYLENRGGVYGNTGYFLNGWQYIDGHWYYLNTLNNNNEKTGMLYHDKSNWKQETDDNINNVNLNSYGICTNCKNVWIHGGEDSYRNRYWYHTDGNGNNQTGWQKLSWKGSDKYYYYFDGNGRMLANTSIVYNGKTYYFGSDGRCTNDNYKCS